MNRISITITDAQSRLPVEKKRLARAVRMILRDESIASAKISVAVVDDPTIAELHRRYMNDPAPTDVLSFALEKTADFLEGEIVASADTAYVSAPRYNWPATDELLLYVIHGTLHLAGYDDAMPKQRKIMRKKEREYLDRCGVN